jgi:hypothetical protein
MPKSKVRKKPAYTPPEDILPGAAARARARRPSPRWLAPVMVGLMLLGLLWIVVFYVAGDKIAIMNTLGPWNFAVGFAAMVTGLAMSMKWR